MADLQEPHPQALRYAADLARLYERSREDRQALERLEARLVEISKATLSLARAMSSQEAASRLVEFGLRLLGGEEAAVYSRKGDRFERLAQRPREAAFPVVAPVRAVDLEALAGSVDELRSEPWSRLSPGPDPVSILPLRGRSRAVGFLAVRSSIPVGREGELNLLGLLGCQAGVLLENLHVDRSTGRHRRSALRAADDGAESDLGPVSQASQGLLNIVGHSEGMRTLFRMLEKLAKVDTTVLIEGETGTGKSLVAKALHMLGPTQDRPFVTLNCAAIPEALVESELFGHEAGAFTGATRKHVGRIEEAEGGTLFLDEVGELSAAVQAKLLVFLEERTYRRVGGERDLQAHVRILSATNRDLAQRVAAGEFREDLLFRLNVFTLRVPPLRERGEDVQIIAVRLVEQLAERFGIPTPEFTEQSLRALERYDWPGNVRELRNVIEKAVVLSEGSKITPDLLPDSRAANTGGSEPPHRASLEELVLEEGLAFTQAKAQATEVLERDLLVSLLEATQGNVAQAARLAQMDKKHLHQKLKKLELDAEAFRDSKD